MSPPSRASLPSPLGHQSPTLGSLYIQQLITSCLCYRAHVSVEEKKRVVVICSRSCNQRQRQNLNPNLHKCSFFQMTEPRSVLFIIREEREKREISFQSESFLFLTVIWDIINRICLIIDPESSICICFKSGNFYYIRVYITAWSHYSSLRIQDRYLLESK